MTSISEDASPTVKKGFDRGCTENRDPEGSGTATIESAEADVRNKNLK